MFGTTTLAAPRTYAAPATYAGQATRAYAAPASYAAPAAYAAAPIAAPAVTTLAPSYAAPQAIATMPQYAPQVAMPGAPPRLTQGIPTPEQIAAQKAQYAAALDKQLEQAKATVIQETKIEQQMIKFSADKQVDLYGCQVKERQVEQEALAEEQSTIAALELKKALVERNLQLDSQAAGLTMDYKMKELMTACSVKQYQFQQQYITAENKLAGQYNVQLAKAGGVGV